MPIASATLRLELPVAPDLASAWHARPAAMARLSPPWERPAARGGLGVAGLSHARRIEPRGDGCVVEDHVEWRLPRGPLAASAGARIRRRLVRVFAWRHDVTRRDLERLAARRGTLALGVTGASGFIGRELCAFLESQGHRIVRFVRGRGAGPGEIAWDPAEERLDPESLAGLDAVIHLSGAGIAERRWTRERMRELVESRTRSTLTLARALAACPERPRVLVTMSGVGAYGDRGDEWLDEASEPGRGFLASLAREWEQSADPARDAGVRVAHARTGVVLWPLGGALEKLLPLFRLGAGGRLGNGRAWWSWIGLHDLLDALLFAVESESLAGPFNAVAPAPVRQGDLARALGRSLGRPALVPAPAIALRMLLGRARADEMLLASQRAWPTALLGAKFRFREPELSPLLDRLFGRARAPAHGEAARSRA